MRKYELKQFLHFYKILNETAKKIFNDKNYEGVTIINNKIFAVYNDGFYKHTKDITKEISEELLPDETIF